MINSTTDADFVGLIIDLYVVSHIFSVNYHGHSTSPNRNFLLRDSSLDPLPDEFPREIF